VKPALMKFGKGEHPVVVIDDFSGAVGEIVDIADALGPLGRQEGNFYPGLRRIISRGDRAADAYVERTLQAAAPFIAGAFDCGGFDLLEASFSMITADPASLLPQQRAPHFDSTDPKYLAVLHYLNVPAGTGTAFYRQRSTGFEQVGEANVGIFVRVAQREIVNLPADSGYIAGSDAHFEQIGAVEAVPDRLIIYQGSVLHCGIIPPGMNLDPNPRHGRLTANLFVRAH
jgi:hypothetical protein